MNNIAPEHESENELHHMIWSISYGDRLYSSSNDEIVVCQELYEPWSKWLFEVWLYQARVMLFSSISGLAIWMVL